MNMQVKNSRIRVKIQRAAGFSPRVARNTGNKNSRGKLRQSKARSCCPPLKRALNPRLFKALGDPTRILILIRLAQCRGPLTVSQAAQCCSVDLSVVSRHLTILRNADVVNVQKRGRMMFYEVRYDELTQTLRALANALEACCPV